MTAGDRIARLAPAKVAAWARVRDAAETRDERRIAETMIDQWRRGIADPSDMIEHQPAHLVTVLHRISDPRGWLCVILRRVTRSTGHHVFSAVTARGERRIASDTTYCRLHASAPAYIARALAALGYDSERGRVDLSSARMSDHAIRRLRADWRAGR